jgi:hypothetical protein
MRMGALAAGLVAMLAACAGGSPSPAREATAPAASTASTAESQGGPEALGFTAPLVGGGELDAATLAGSPVVLWFWAPY